MTAVAVGELRTFKPPAVLSIVNSFSQRDTFVPLLEASVQVATQRFRGSRNTAAQKGGLSPFPSCPLFPLSLIGRWSLKAWVHWTHSLPFPNVPCSEQRVHATHCGWQPCAPTAKPHDLEEHGSWDRGDCSEWPNCVLMPQGPKLLFRHRTVFFHCSQFFYIWTGILANGPWSIWEESAPNFPGFLTSFL